MNQTPRHPVLQSSSEMETASPKKIKEKQSNQPEVSKEIYSTAPKK
jgi:hypothetical protein